MAHGWLCFLVSSVNGRVVETAGSSCYKRVIISADISYIQTVCSKYSALLINVTGIWEDKVLINDRNKRKLNLRDYKSIYFMNAYP
jgi:hypothetical protein